MDKLMVSHDGLQFLKGSVYDEKNHKTEYKIQQEITAEKIAKEKERRYRDMHRHTIIWQAAKDVEINLLKLDIGYAFQTVTEQLHHEKYKKSPSFLIHTQRKKRYPAGLLQNPSGSQSCKSVLSKFSSKKVNFGPSKFFSRPGHHKDSYLVETMRSIVKANSQFGQSGDASPLTPLSKFRSQKGKKGQVEVLPPAPIISPQQLLIEAIAELEAKSLDVNPDIHSQILARVEKYKKLKPTDLSDNCTTELKELQKLQKLLYKHSAVEEEFKLRRQKEEVGRIANTERKVDAGKILKTATNISSQFEVLGEDLSVVTKSKASLSLIREDLRKLKTINPHHAEKQIGNLRHATENSKSSFRLPTQNSPITLKSRINLPSIGPSVIEKSTNTLILK